MKQFYQSTYYFWIVTKFIFAIAVFISAISNLGIHDLTIGEKFANSIGTLYAILLVVDLIFSLNESYHKFLKYVLGVMSIILGLIICILMIKVSVKSIPIAIVFMIWILLLGFFDLLLVEKRSQSSN